MNPQEMRVGAVYMVRGGHILRYRGVYASSKGYQGFNPAPPRPKDNPCLAFGSVQDEGPFDPPVGYSALAEDALYEITPKDLPWIRDRREQLLARKLPVEDVEHLITELERKAS